MDANFKKTMQDFQQGLEHLAKDPKSIDAATRKELEVLKVSLDKIIISGSGSSGTGGTGGTQPK